MFWNGVTFLILGVNVESFAPILWCVNIEGLLSIDCVCLCFELVIVLNCSVFAVLSGIVTWSWKTWRRCGQKSPKAGRERRSRSRSIKIATFPKCSSGGTLSSLSSEILWFLENELFFSSKIAKQWIDVFVLFGLN